MCWVMPPASPAATLAWRSASSSEVLPWSTWPMTVTIGGRGTSSSGRSSAPSMPISTSASLTRFTRCPNSDTTSSAVSGSSIWLMVAMMPFFISTLTTSAPRTAMRAARSWTVMVSGSTTSRTIGSAWPAIWRRSRSRWRRSAARLGPRRSSSSASGPTMWRSTRFGPPSRPGRGRVVGGRRSGILPRSLPRRASASLSVSSRVALAPAGGRRAASAVVAGAAALGASPGRPVRASTSRCLRSSSASSFAAWSSALRRASSSCLRRASSSALRLAEASSSALRRAASSAARREFSSAR